MIARWAHVPKSGRQLLIDCAGLRCVLRRVNLAGGPVSPAVRITAPAKAGSRG